MLLFLFALAAAQTCSGVTYLTGNSGRIVSNTGPEYAGSTYCSWYITPSDPSVRSILIEFDYFDSEMYYDVLVFQDGPNGWYDPQLRWFSGAYPTPPQSFSSSGRALTVFFWSDSVISGRGFSFNYSSQFCQTSCSDHGVCHGNSCSCYVGWSSSDCSIGSCMNNCSGYGKCIQDPVGSHCECTKYFGNSCNQRYCSGLTTLTAPSATVTQHYDGGAYLGTADCTWLISPRNSDGTRFDSIALSFSAFDVEAGYDFLEVYDGTAASGILLAKLSGTNIPPTVRATSGDMFLRWTTDMGLERTGFVASYEASNCDAPCVNGHCVSNTCHCQVGFGGELCEHAVCINDCNNQARRTLTNGSSVVFNQGTCSSDGQQCTCNTPFAGLDCSSCSNDPICAGIQQGQCQGVVTNQALEGVITHNTNGEPALAGLVCGWLLRPPIDVFSADPSGTYTLSFSKFRLGGGAVISIFDGTDSSAPLLVQLSGVRLPPSIYSTGPAMYVLFSSNINTEGFQASFAYKGCNKTCTHGLCVSGSCVCSEGWSGTHCDQPFCDASVCPLCLHDECHCPAGYFGSSCSSTECSGLLTLEEDYRVIADGVEGTPYQKNKVCQWDITLREGNQASFVFLRLQSEISDKIVIIEPNSHAVLGQYWGRSVPLPFTLAGNHFLIQFTTNGALEYEGFALSFTSTNRCPNNCSGYGHCMDTTCLCEQGRSGSSCQNIAPIRILHTAYPAQGNVSAMQWRYFRFTTTAETSSVSFLLSTSVGRISNMFGKVHSIPSPQTFDSSSVGQLGNTLSVSMKTTGVVDVFVAFYTTQKATYQLKVSPECGCYAPHVCGESGGCTCSSCYTGTMCETYNQSTCNDPWVAEWSDVTEGCLGCACYDGCCVEGLTCNAENVCVEILSESSDSHVASSSSSSNIAEPSSNTKVIVFAVIALLLLLAVAAAVYLVRRRRSGPSYRGLNEAQNELQAQGEEE